jgi:hypothetical protein
MSKLEADKIKMWMSNKIDLKYQSQIEEIFRDRKMFTPFSHVEEDRFTTRQNTNTMLLSLLNQASKIKPLGEVFNDIFLWVAMLTPVFLNNDEIATKMAVNF